ncbi:MAG: TonB family protein [Ignavibacteria bacterium]|nr:TonB family protein [Ignavibacteria bacterium]
MKLKIALLVLLCFSVGIAQQKNKNTKSDKGKWEELKEYPKPINPIQPEYPQVAKLAGIEGKVYVEALISENGDVLEAKVLKSDHETLNGASIAAIKATKFSPGISNKGKKVKIAVVIPISFKLDDKDKEAKFVSPGVRAPSYDETDPDIDAYIKVEKFPEMISPATPDYPEEAKKNKITGKTFVKVLIDKEGNPKKAVVIKSQNELFNQPAVDAALKSKFTPALQGGKPIAVWIVLPYRFTLPGVKDSNEREYFSVLIVGMDNDLYPKEALDKKIEGNVLIRILLDDNGKLKNSEIYKSDNELLNKAAIEHLSKNWDDTYSTHNKAFKEAKDKGTIVPADAELKSGSIICVSFELKDFKKYLNH